MFYRNVALIVVLAGFLAFMQIGMSADISGEATGLSTYVGAKDYCRGLSTVCEYHDTGAACDATSYYDWDLPTVAEAAPFVGIVTDTSWVWVDEIHSGGKDGKYMKIRLGNGQWSQQEFGDELNVRCVR